MINGQRRSKRISGMAVFADGRCLDVCQASADGNRAVMTGVTRSQNLCVVHDRHGSKQIRVVAVLTNIGRLNVRRILACCLCTVVATYAVTNNIYMVEQCWQPTNRCVAVVAGVRTCNVGRMFAHGGNAIMAGAAGPYNLGVIYGDSR